MSKRKTDREAELSSASSQMVNKTAKEEQIDTIFYPDAVKPGVHPDISKDTQLTFKEQLPDNSVAAPEFDTTLKANMRQFNTVSRAFDYLSNAPKNTRLGWDEGYDPIYEGVLDGVPEQYYGAVLSANNKDDALKVRQRIFDELSDVDVRERSGWFANLSTTLGASILDPTIFFPVAATTKYANYGRSLTMNALKTGGSLAPAIGLQNFVLTGTKETEDVRDWATNTLTETLMASAFGGLMGGFASKGSKSELNGAKAFFKGVDKDIDIKYKLSEKGVVEGLQAVSQYGGSAGAAEVEGIQALLDSVPSVNFKDNKFIKTAFGWGQPIIEGLTNKFPVVRDLTNKLIPHNFQTAAGVLDNIQAPSARDFVKMWEANRAQAQMFNRAQWLDYLGIKGTAKNLRGAVGEWTGRHMAEKEFNEQVAMSIRRDAKHDIPQVGRAARTWIDEVYKPLFEEAQKRFPNLKDHTFTNIVNYMNRSYDKNKIASDPEGFLNDVTSYLSDTNAKVIAVRNLRTRAKNNVIRTERELKAVNETGLLDRFQRSEFKLKEAQKMRDELQDIIKNYELHPDTKGEFSKAKFEEYLSKANKEVDKLEAEKIKAQVKLDRIRANPESSAKRLERLTDNLAEQRARLAKVEEQIRDDILSGKISPDMLDAKVNLTTEQFKQVQQLRAPIKEAEKTLEEALLIRRAAIEEGLNFEARQELDLAVKLAREQLAAAKSTLNEALESGLIAKELYTTTSKGRRVLHDPDALPSLRKSLDQQGIADVANSIRDNVMQLNEEQLAGMIFDGLGGGGENVLQARSLLWNDAQAESWLINDIDVLSGLYVDQMSKRTYLQDVLESYGANDFKGVIRQLTDERAKFEKEILKQPDSPERAQQLLDLQKQFNKSTKFMENMYKMYMGNYVDRSTAAYRVTNGIKQFGAGALLGNVPILQFSEFFTPLFKFAFSEYIFDGLVPAINRMKSVLGGAAKEAGEDIGYVRGAFADLGLGVNVATGARMQAMFGVGAQYQPKTIIERYVSNFASMSQNVSLSNLLSDIQETTVAFASQSKTIRSLKRFAEGANLTKKEIARFDEMRLNPKVYAERILEQQKKYGQDVDGAFIGNYHMWDDQDAARAFRIAISKETRSLILRPEILDQPFAFKDPVISLFTQFTSWVFSASLNYTIPILTDFDAQKMIGIIAMMGSASLIDPLRQLAKGEEVDTSFEALSTSGLANSGIFGWQFDALMRANARIDIPAFRGLQPDRFKRKASGALTAGPASGLIDMSNSIISALVNGEMNQKDAQKAVRLLVPFSGTWYLRQPFDKMIEGFGLPKTREKARRRKGE